ncbi:Reverse transcriptase (RNA-dependent DNA polymerase) [Popillia japonica]|uniref:Reverse transcriptase (RNA-dependent DNA polymerase) n=1 Tax=Popillia japonica TaxID=7064 RepID=A0AAW1IZK0_POPJA
MRTNGRTKWVFKTKPCTTEESVKFKARLVVTGCAQTEGIDYQETYSPVVKYTSLRYLFSLAAKKNLEIDHMDVKTAYLQSTLDEEIYVKPPKEFRDPKKPSQVWRLQKSMYGLKQSGRCWNQRLHNVLCKFKMTQAQADPCIYYCKGHDEILIVAVYVDDLLIFSNKRISMDNIKRKLEQEFDMKDLGEVKSCLGMNIARDRKQNKIWIDQAGYVEKILETFKMTDYKSLSTPMNLDLKDLITRTDELTAKVPYQEAVAVQLTKNKISNKSEHIDIRHHFISEHVSNSEVRVEYLATEAMLADQLTKPLPKAKHELIVKEYGLSNSL